ncbi:MAG: LysM peptidoglycan-binding domain-containing protein [Actinobacteria bacterium]|nr:LysM peptidoglycan-binding domain-containing protein [Actinomycetota bacterium]
MFARIVIVLVVAAVVWAVLARDTGASGPERSYVVRAGDTMWSIVEARYAGDPREGVWKLQRRNELDGTTIVPGQRLVLP